MPWHWPHTSDTRADAGTQPEPPPRAAIGREVRRRRPVTRLAGNAELGGAARRHVARLVDARLAAGDMTFDADAIPARRRLAVLLAHQEDIAAWNPAAIVE
jgi:hypothetical protein